MIEIEAPDLDQDEAGWSIGYSEGDIDEIEEEVEVPLSAYPEGGGVWWSADALTLDEALAKLVAQIETVFAAMEKVSS